MIKTDLPQPHAAGLQRAAAFVAGAAAPANGETAGKIVDEMKGKGLYGGEPAKKGNAMKLKDERNETEEPLRTKLKESILELSEAQLKNLWDAITSGVFDVPAEDT